MISMLSWWLARRPWVAASLASLLLLYPTYQFGKWTGAREERAQIELRNKQATVEQLRERLKINEDISNLDDADLCSAIGGELRDGRCE